MNGLSNHSSPAQTITDFNSGSRAGAELGSPHFRKREPTNSVPSYLFLRIKEKGSFRSVRTTMRINERRNRLRWSCGTCPSAIPDFERRWVTWIEIGPVPYLSDQVFVFQHLLAIIFTGVHGDEFFFPQWSDCLAARVFGCGFSGMSAFSS